MKGLKIENGQCTILRKKYAKIQFQQLNLRLITKVADNQTSDFQTKATVFPNDDHENFWCFCRYFMKISIFG